MTRATKVLGALTGLACGLAAFGAPALADVSGGPSVFLPLNTPLKATLHPTVAVDVDATFEVRVTAYLRVGDQSLGRIGRFQALASFTPQTVELPVAPRLLAAARAAGRRSGHRRAHVQFVLTGPGLSRTTNESFVSLRPPVRTTGPTPIRLGGSIAGASGVARGTITVATPSGWMRTSTAGASPATFTAIPLDAGCRADAIIQPAVRAVSSVEKLLAADPPRGTLVRAGRTGANRWAVLASAPASASRTVQAIGIRRLARHRYADVRLYLTLGAKCPPAAARTPALLFALQRVVSRMTARVALSRR